MSRIVTVDHDLRFREREGCTNGFCLTFGHGGIVDGDMVCDNYEELPRVPDWPLPGQAPQYLSDGPDCPVKVGDTVIIVQPPPAVVMGWNDGKYVARAWGEPFVIRVRLEDYNDKTLRDVVLSRECNCDYDDHCTYGSLKSRWSEDGRINGYGAVAYLIARADPEEDA